MNGPLFVKDLLAVDAPRVHELAPGKRFALEADKATEVPYEIANRLVGMEGFEIALPNGTVLRHVDAKDAAGHAMKLRADQVVADLAEITTEALLVRCQEAVPEGKWRLTTGKQAMIDALIAAASAQETGDEEPAFDPSVDFEGDFKKLAAA